MIDPFSQQQHSFSQRTEINEIAALHNSFTAYMLLYRPLCRFKRNILPHLALLLGLNSFHRYLIPLQLTADYCVSGYEQGNAAAYVSNAGSYLLLLKVSLQKIPFLRSMT